jgi:RES domain-containing protein
MEPNAALIASLPLATEQGRWQRHAPANRLAEALDGRRGYGRWGTAEGFTVLYLGRPRSSVIVEAYRHLVDPLEDDADRAAILATVRPRVLVTCHVDVSTLLDLRTAGARNTAGLTISDLTSSTDDQDTYHRCQHVAQIAHQLGRHGIIVPAATGLGDTLALFTDLLPPNERPILVEGTEEHWSTLPDDPRIAPLPERRLRVVGDDRPRKE